MKTACLSPRPCLTALHPYPAATLPPISDGVCVCLGLMCWSVAQLCAFQSSGALGFCVQGKSPSFLGENPPSPLVAVCTRGTWVWCVLTGLHPIWPCLSRHPWRKGQRLGNTCRETPCCLHMVVVSVCAEWLWGYISVQHLPLPKSFSIVW